MITEEMLAAAAEEVSLCMIQGLPSHPHTFSEAFEKKMRKLLRRTLHPVRYQILRYTAAVLVAIFTIFSVPIAVSPEVRAAVVGWVKSAFHEFFEYSSESPSPTNADVGYDYFLSETSSGYTLLNSFEKNAGNLYIYTNSEGHILQFSYTRSADGNGLFVDTDGYDVHVASVNNQPADIYISQNSSEASVIVWQDTTGNILFQITAYADKEELLVLAENIKKREIN